jgi:hypothetical protein
MFSYINGKTKKNLKTKKNEQNEMPATVGDVDK